MEEHGYVERMQDEMKRQVEKARPKFLVFVSLPMSWFVASWSKTGILDWAMDYSSRNYQPVGFVNISSDGTTDYCLPCDKLGEPWPPSLLILQRNP